MFFALAAACWCCCCHPRCLHLRLRLAWYRLVSSQSVHLPRPVTDLLLASLSALSVCPSVCLCVCHLPMCARAALSHSRH